MLDGNAQAVHIAAQMPPLLSINGRLAPSSMNKLDEYTVNRLAYSLMNKVQEEKFSRDNSINFTYRDDTFGRFRINFYKQRGHIGGLIKLIPAHVPSLDELNLPEVIKNQVVKLRKGLVIISGPSGCGKSTTQAAMLDCINSQRRCHIITLEDPIEYFHEHKKALISQREIGADSYSFAQAIREATRQDADVIMVGEMRDTQTINIALTAAETGSLVLGTMHTQDAVQTINRIITSFPSDKQYQIRTQLAVTLKVVISQQLVMRADTNSRVPAVEIMFVTKAIQNMIRNKNVNQIYSAVESGGGFGMQTLDQALNNLYKTNVISEIEAVTKSVAPVQASRQLKVTSSIPPPQDIAGEGFSDAGEDIIHIDKRLIRYHANFTPGQEGYWTSSKLVVFDDTGMSLSTLASSETDRFYVSDFNIVGKRVSPFALPKRMLVRFKLELGNEKDALGQEAKISIKLFTQPEQGKISSYNKVNLSFPLAPDDKWHTWVIKIPNEVIGKLLKINMLEFPPTLTKVLISDIIFF